MAFPFQDYRRHCTDG